MGDEDIIDHSVFDQLTEMDDEGDNEFSKSIVYNFFEQAESTFTSMDTELSKKDLTALSRLGHFLKGSSATLGLKKVKSSCEKIQYYGSLKDETGSNIITEQQALEKVTALLKKLKEEYKEAKKYLQALYE